MVRDARRDVVLRVLAGGEGRRKGEREKVRER